MADIYTPKTRFKGRVLVGLSLAFIVGLVVTLSVLYFTMLDPIGPSYGRGLDMLTGMRQGILYRALVVFGITFLVMAMGIIVLSMLYSHRIAGPLYRLTQYVKTLADGQLQSRVSLREKDVIHPIAEELNGMVEEYRKNLQEIKQQVESLEEMTARLEQGDVSLDQIQEKADTIHRMTDNYRLAN